MHTVSLFDAKTHLSRIVDSIVEGAETQVVISRRGKAVVCLTPFRKTDVSKRIGLARGRFEVPDTIDRANAAIATLFAGGKSPS
jgi:antitoxin (DNA-binding transcriptional repressor) of toxin-antitoxin stability system